MVQPGSTTTRRGALIALLVSAMALLMAGLGQRAAQADVTAVRGSAFNCSANFNFFGQPQPPVQPTASVTLPPGGSAAPLTATDDCVVRITFPNGAPGPFILSTGPITLTTQGTTGPTGSVTSTATANDVGVDPTEALQATSISSTCTATESGVTGSTTVTGGTVVTNQTAGTVAAVPTNPAPNFTIEGINGAGDRYRYVFNEQTTAADGTLTVNAVHLYLLGPNAIGDVILGQVVCDVTAVAVTTTVAPTTTVPQTTTTTVPQTTTTTVAQTTTTTVLQTTTTTVAQTTTTTVPQTTTTTVPQTTTTTVPQTTTTTVPQTTTTTVPQTTTTTVAQTTTTRAGDCIPGQNGAKPGYGKGDKNHVHCGPPGQSGMRPTSSTSDARPSGPLLVGLVLLFLTSLALPFQWSRREPRS